MHRDGGARPVIAMAKRTSDYVPIQAGAFALGVGADLVDLGAIRRGEAATITDKAGQYVAAVAAARS